MPTTAQRACRCVFVLLGMTWLSPAIGARADAPLRTLSAFRNEGELQAFLDSIQAAAERQRQAEKAAREAYLKAHPTAPPSGTSTGSIAGNTTPGAIVVIENPDTGFKREITAGADGSYRVGNLPTGQYKVTSGGIVRDVAVTIGGTATGSSMSLDAVAVTGSAVMVPEPGNDTGATTSEDGITNVQTAGVDEGGIVKKSGDFLVVLRRGRLFSIRADDKSLQTISTVNAFGTGISSNAWYDEMLISGDTIVVIGYSYGRGGTEVGLFHFSEDGQIAYRATYHLFSNDYYSSRNYASRLVGKTLIFYSPIDLYSLNSSAANFPGVRRWNAAAPKARFERIAPAERIYRSGLAEDSLDQTLHTVTRCELSAATMDCRSASVLGPSGASFYVSREAVYVWMVSYGDERSGDSDDDEEQASVLRMPLDESPPSALRVQGSPIDQLSFLEKGGYLNVLVGAEAKGLRMWSAENRKSGGLALLRVPVSEFGGAGASTRPEHYRALPSGLGGDGYWYLHNRYVGNWLLYGGEERWSPAYALRIDRKDRPTRLRLGHVVERIEAMGNDALVVGEKEGDLRLSSIGLDAAARRTNQFTLPGASQGETRTHGFFYRPLADSEGVFGLPVVNEQEDGKENASVAFVRNDHRQLLGVGDLSATATASQDEKTDSCVASCYDWYGDARPIFIGDRVYALLGYELIEGTLEGDRVRELRRVNFMPQGKGH
jgi:Beta propeller domain